MVMQSPDLIIPKIEYSEVLKDLYNGTGVILANATKININEDKLEEQKVEETKLASTTEDAYFRTNFNNQSNYPGENEDQKAYLVGAILEKTIKEENEETGEKAVTSKLIIYGENYFVTNYALLQNSGYPAIQLAQNKDLVLNSLAYLVDRPEDITARKSTGTVVYTATEAQDRTIKIIIFAIPIIIIIAGIIVWNVRRRKK